MCPSDQVMGNWDAIIRLHLEVTIPPVQMLQIAIIKVLEIVEEEDCGLLHLGKKVVTSHHCNWYCYHKILEFSNESCRDGYTLTNGCM